MKNKIQLVKKLGLVAPLMALVSAIIYALRETFWGPCPIFGDEYTLMWIHIAFYFSILGAIFYVSSLIMEIQIKSITVLEGGKNAKRK